jgi:hypothetical protein
MVPPVTKQTLIVVLSLWHLVLPASAQDVEIIALTGKKAPGTTKRFTQFDAPAAGPNGEVAFVGYTSGEQGGHTLYLGQGGKLRAVARYKKRAPGMPTGTVFLDPYPIGFDEAGRLYFASDTFLRNDVEAVSSGVWRGTRAGDVELIARSNDPNIPGLLEIVGSTLGPGGHVAVIDEMDHLFVTRTAGGLVTVTDSVTPLPGLPNGWFDGFRPFLDRAGNVTLSARSQSSFGAGVWRWTSPGPLEVVALAGDLPANDPRPLAEVFVADANPTGNVLGLSATLLGDDGFPETACFLTSEDGPPAVLVCSGTPAFGAPPGTVFGSFGELRIADDGHRLFVGYTWGGVSGIWNADGDGPVTPLAITGTAVADLPGTALDAPTTIHLGHAGEAAFEAGLLEKGTTPGHARKGVFHVRAGGSPVLVLRNRDPLRLPSGKQVAASYRLAYPGAPPAVHGDIVALRAFLDDARQAIIAVRMPPGP